LTRRQRVATERPCCGVLAVEDAVSYDHRLIRADALYWTCPIPIRSENTGVIGKIYSIVREGLYVWGEGLINDLDGCIACGFDLSEMDVELIDDVLVFKSARLFAVTVYPDNMTYSAWPGTALLTY
jgi:hypothetical protein